MKLLLIVFKMQKTNHKIKKQPVPKLKIIKEKLKGSFIVSENIPHAYFPFEPYPQQVQIIRAIHDSVKKSKNALIDSPTGTGKTLCALVGVLSSAHTNRTKIYYLTRTHSQIAQVIQEIKKTVYGCRVNIMASREQLCINPNLQELKGVMLDKACQETCQQNLCRYRDIQSYEKAPPLQTIEQLRKTGKKQMICPYYLSKGSVTETHLTILPYSYLLDWKLFSFNTMPLKDSVLIFDEAHNIDSLAEEGCSLDISIETLTLSLRQIKRLEQITHANRHQSQQYYQNYDQIADCSLLISAFLSRLKVSQIQKSFTTLYQVIEELKLMTTFENTKTDLSFSGIDLGNYEQVIDWFKKVNKHFFTRRLSCEYFENFLRTIEKMMAILDSNDFQHYAVSISEKHALSSSQVSMIPKKAFIFHCLNANIAFNGLAKHKPKSIILLSGTLEPLSSWETDLGLKFPIKLKVSDFIQQKQFVGCVVSQNKFGQVYNFSYQKKNNESQYQSLAEQLNNISFIVPNGIVVAVSSYEIMEKLLPKCLNLKKKVFYESKNTGAEYVYDKFCAEAKNNGAFLFIIMKGRFAEGINFNDELCRCLVVVGIPFLPLKDIRIQKKKAYIQNRTGREDADSWYVTQTFRVVNQVLGRVIRSKKDYGSFLLYDQRYCRDEIKEQLASWFRKKVSFKKHIEEIQCFFQNKSWMSIEQQDSKPESTTINKFHQTSPTLEQLLNFETPQKQKKKLMIDEESEQQKQKKIQIQNKHTKPWESIDFFINQNGDLADLDTEIEVFSFYEKRKIKKR